MSPHLPLSITALTLLLAGASVSAQVYKCEVPGKPPEYRTTPCSTGGTSTRVQVPAAALRPARPAPHIEPRLSPEELDRLQREAEARPPSLDDRATLSFDSLDLRLALQVLADFMHRPLVVNCALPETGAFHYQNVPTRVILADLAQRFRLRIRTDDGKTITVERPAH